jgi:hypothetical protein
MDNILAIISSLIVVAIIIGGVYFKKNKKFKQVIEAIDEVSDLADKATELIPQNKISKGTLKILDVVKAADAAADPKLTLEQKQELVAKSTKQILDKTGHPQALDEEAIRKAIKKVIK